MSPLWCCQVKHNDVRNVLVRGHIFLNCSLTEAFCIAILEAASCGLLVVSTKVGGVPEVMPANMIRTAPPDAKDLIRVLARAISKDVKDVVPQEFHDRVRRMYSWRDVALRTCKVYDRVERDEARPLLQRLQATRSRGPVFGEPWRARARAIGREWVGENGWARAGGRAHARERVWWRGGSVTQVRRLVSLVCAPGERLSDCSSDAGASLGDCSM
jgi:hypothetical protein